MPFVLAILGLVLIISGVRDSTGDLVKLVEGDFTGNNNFVYWLLAILIVGGAGYIDELRSVSRTFLVLILIVLFLAESKNSTTGGFFEQFTTAVAKITGASNG